MCNDSRDSVSFLVHFVSIAAENAVHENVQSKLIKMQTLILKASLDCSRSLMKLKSLSSNNIFSTTSACSGKSCRTVISIPTIFSPIRGVLESVNRNYKIIIFRKYQEEVLVCLDHIAKYHILFTMFSFFFNTVLLHKNVAVQYKKTM